MLQTVEVETSADVKVWHENLKESMRLGLISESDRVWLLYIIDEHCRVGKISHNIDLSSL